MATETEQLVVLLEARIRDFERNMAKANATAQKEFGAIERRGAQSAKKMQGLFADVGIAIKGSFGSISGGFLAGGLAGLLSEQTIRALGNVVKSVADMADEAHRVGLGVEDFQALTFAARQSGVESDKLTGILQKFNLELGEAASKGNDLSRILAANGVPLLDANGKLRDQKMLFYAIVDLIRNAKSQQDAAVLSMAAFGKGAADALPFLQQGSEAIKDGEKAAHGTGAVIKKELVEKAAAFDDAWTAVWDSWTARGKAAVLEVMSESEGLFAKLDAFVSSSGLTSDNLRGSGIIPGLNERQISELEWLFPSLKPTDAKRATDLEAQLLDLTAKRANIEKQIADAQTAGAAPIELQEYQDRLAIVLGQLDETRSKLEAINEVQVSVGVKTDLGGSRNAPGAPSTVIPKSTGSEDVDKATAAAMAKANALEAQKKALDKLLSSQQRENASLRVEAEAVGMTTYSAARLRKEQELLNAANAAGVPITDQVKASIAALAAEYAKGQVAVENAQRAQEAAAQSAEELQQARQQAAQQFEGTFAGATKGFVSDLMRGVDATEALQNALANLADQLMSMAVDNLLSGLLSAGTGKALSGGGLFRYFGLADGGEVGRDGRMMKRFASGGAVSGPGGPRDDKIPSMLSNGEFVIRADQAAKHRALLEAINSGFLPRFADGGSVGSPHLPNAPASKNVNSSLAVTNNITVNSNSKGDQKGDHELAKQISREIENSVRGIVNRELRDQLRPGNMLSR